MNGQLTISAEEYRNMKPKKANKYLNKKVTDGVNVFDSQKEYRRFLELRILQDKNEISELKRQERFDIVIGKMKVCSYVSDYTYRNKNGTFIVEDVKSEFTRKQPVYRLKKKLMKAVLNIEISEN